MIILAVANYILMQLAVTIWGLSTYFSLAFVFQCKKLDPTTFKLCQGKQPKLSKLFESYASNLRESSAELSSSDPGSEA